MSLKINYHLFICWFFLLIVGCNKSKKVIIDTPIVIENKIINYDQDQTNFCNPERGFYGQSVSYSTSPTPFSKTYFDQLKTKNITLVRKIYSMTSFRTGAISAVYLQHIQDDFDLLRSNGFKVILRFSYTFNEAGAIDDAPMNSVLSHIEQLASLLQKNANVIALMEAGFIGQWGEWHDSSNGLANPADMKTILFKLLEVLPKTRAVAVRYQQAKKDILQVNEPIAATAAFTQTNQARIGHHNDCFLASDDDYGTYWPLDAASLDAQKNYLNQENKYLPQIGETCNCNPPRSDCTVAIKELEKMRWSALNKDFIECVLNGWAAQGCYEEIAKRLGYRFRLITAELSNAIKNDSLLTVKLVLKNEGFASPYNAHDAALIFRSKANGSIQKIKLDIDVRTWLPENNDIKLNIKVLIPSAFAAGEYDLLLNFPDPEKSLNTNPAYSIRLANQNVWEAATGYNSLLTSITILK